jgi:dipeptidyl aminopeptidase/acylaminoacyl peptidase
VHGQLFLPTHPTASTRPALLFFHGGPYRQMLPAFHPMDAYSFMYAFNQLLANEGYVVLSVNYRGGIGYGLDFREAQNFGAAGASELNDILGAAAYLHTRADIDPTRIGIWGGSYGGLMTALGLARGPDLFAAGVDYAGVHDWRIELPQLTGAAADLAFRSSALSTMDRWRAPVLIAHNDDDRDVPFSESIKLADALREHGVSFEQLVLPDEVHAMLRAVSWLTFFETSDRFLARYLHPPSR